MGREEAKEEGKKERITRRGKEKDEKKRMGKVETRESNKRVRRGNKKDSKIKRKVKEER